jgi:hypothetical protein
MKHLLCAFGLSLCATVAPAGTPCPTYASALLPQVLADSPAASIRIACQDIKINGDALTAIAYSNGFGGGILLTRTTDNGAGGTVLHAPEETMFDQLSSIDAIDTDGGGRPEIVVTFRSATGSGAHLVWVYAMRNLHLDLLTPSVTGDGPLTDPEFVDLDGTGRLAIVDRKLDIEPDPEDDTGVSRLVTPSFTTYTVQENGYRPATTSTLSAERFERDNAEPVTEQVYFGGMQGGGAAVTLLNGDNARGDNACDAGDVFINGQRVFRPEDFKTRHHVTAATAQVFANNTLSVRLDAAPGCHVFVLVQQNP